MIYEKKYTYLDFSFKIRVESNFWNKNYYTFP